MERLKYQGKNRSQSPNILPPLEQDIIKAELTSDQRKTVIETIQPLFKRQVKSLISFI
jgi:hypothetical protein